jgi:3,4-dihydroxy-2-butanone 4-phosphate synthase
LAYENETLRWPTNLDHAAIVRRLVEIRNSARESGFAELAAHLANVEGMTPAHIGASVIAAMTLVQEKPEHGSIATQLEMIAMNLKNL